MDFNGVLEVFKGIGRPSEKCKYTVVKSFWFEPAKLLVDLLLLFASLFWGPGFADSVHENGTGLVEMLTFEMVASWLGAVLENVAFDFGRIWLIPGLSHRGG